MPSVAPQPTPFPPLPAQSVEDALEDLASSPPSVSRGDVVAFEYASVVPPSLPQQASSGEDAAAERGARGERSTSVPSPSPIASVPVWNWYIGDVVDVDDHRVLVAARTGSLQAPHPRSRSTPIGPLAGGFSVGNRDAAGRPRQSSLMEQLTPGEIGAMRADLAQKQARLQQLMQMRRQHEQDRHRRAVDVARKEVESIQPREIHEMQSYRNPPRAVQRVLEAVLAVLGVPFSSNAWTSVQSSVRQPGFLQSVIEFDPGQLSVSAKAALRSRYLRDPLFAPESLKKASHAATSLGKWVVAQIDYMPAPSANGSPYSLLPDFAIADADVVEQEIRETEDEIFGLTVVLQAAAASAAAKRAEDEPSADLNTPEPISQDSGDHVLIDPFLLQSNRSASASFGGGGGVTPPAARRASIVSTAGPAWPPGEDTGMLQLMRSAVLCVLSPETHSKDDIAPADQRRIVQLSRLHRLELVDAYSEQWITLQMTREARYQATKDLVRGSHRRSSIASSLPSYTGRSASPIAPGRSRAGSTAQLHISHVGSAASPDRPLTPRSGRSYMYNNDENGVHDGNREPSMGGATMTELFQLRAKVQAQHGQIVSLQQAKRSLTKDVRQLQDALIDKDQELQVVESVYEERLENETTALAAELDIVQGELQTVSLQRDELRAAFDQSEASKNEALGAQQDLYEDEFQKMKDVLEAAQLAQKVAEDRAALAQQKAREIVAAVQKEYQLKAKAAAEAQESGEAAEAMRQIQSELEQMTARCERLDAAQREMEAARERDARTAQVTMERMKRSADEREAALLARLVEAEARLAQAPWPAAAVAEPSQPLSASSRAGSVPAAPVQGSGRSSHRMTGSREVSGRYSPGTPLSRAEPPPRHPPLGSSPRVQQPTAPQQQSQLSLSSKSASLSHSISRTSPSSSPRTSMAVAGTSATAALSSSTPTKSPSGLMGSGVTPEPIPTTEEAASPSLTAASSEATPTIKTSSSVPAPSHAAGAEESKAAFAARVLEQARERARARRAQQQQHQEVK